MPKNVQTTTQVIALISYTSKIMLKILQAGLQQYMNLEVPDLQAGFKKAEESEIKLPTFVGSQKKQESFRKTSTFASLTILKPLMVWITTNYGKFLKRWEYQTISPVSQEICMQVNKQQIEPHLGQHSRSKLGKEYDKAVYCHPAYLNQVKCSAG